MLEALEVDETRAGTQLVLLAWKEAKSNDDVAVEGGRMSGSGFRTGLLYAA